MEALIGKVIGIKRLTPSKKLQIVEIGLEKPEEKIMKWMNKQVKVEEI